MFYFFSINTKYLLNVFYPIMKINFDKKKNQKLWPKREDREPHHVEHEHEIQLGVQFLSFGLNDR